jgi:hypothetical protein
VHSEAVTIQSRLERATSSDCNSSLCHIALDQMDDQVHPTVMQLILCRIRCCGHARRNCSALDASMQGCGKAGKLDDRRFVRSKHGYCPHALRKPLYSTLMRLFIILKTFSLFRFPITLATEAWCSMVQEALPARPLIMYSYTSLRP